MSDENETDDVEVAVEKAAPAEGPLAGERLAAARREQQITVLEVAKELHLDEPKVRALEQNEFEVLGAPVFAKGHLRKYASLVGVDMDDVLQDYYKLNRSSGMPPVVGKVRKPAREFSAGPWIGAIVIVLIVAAAYWWFVVAREPAELPVLQPADSELQSPNLADTGVTDGGFETVTVDLPAPVIEDPVEDEFVAEAVLTETPQLTAAAVDAGQVRLTMNFSGECWTEITDASGRQLYFDLGREGRIAEVTGEAPLSVLFGSADNVSVSVNGSDYAISPADRHGETARLTIHSP